MTIKGNGTIDVTAADANGYGAVNNFGTLTVVDAVSYTHLANRKEFQAWKDEIAMCAEEVLEEWGCKCCLLYTSRCV